MDGSWMGIGWRHSSQIPSIYLIHFHNLNELLFFIAVCRMEKSIWRFSKAKGELVSICTVMTKEKVNMVSSILSSCVGILLLFLLLIFLALVYQHNATPSLPISQSSIICKLKSNVSPAWQIFVVDSNLDSVVFLSVNDGLNGPSISQNDSRLIAKVRSSYLYPPPPPSVPLNLTDANEFDPSMGQSQVIKRLVKYKVWLFQITRCCTLCFSKIIWCINVFDSEMDFLLSVEH